MLTKDKSTQTGTIKFSVDIVDGHKVPVPDILVAKL